MQDNQQQMVSEWFDEMIEKAKQSSTIDLSLILIGFRDETPIYATKSYLAECRRLMR